MKYYLAKEDNVPFYKNGDKHTKEEWLQKLHISSEQFEEMMDSRCPRDFYEMETNITSEIYDNRIGHKQIFVYRQGNIMTNDELNLLKADIDVLLEKYNKE